MRGAWMGLWCLLAWAMPGMGQGWERVQGLAARTEVMVETAGGEKITGKLSAVTANSVVLGAGKGERRVGREEVRAVSRRVQPARRGVYTAVGVAIGVAIGVAAAVPLGQKQCGGSCDAEKAAMAGLLAGAPIGGAVLGYKLAGPGTWAEVYRGN